MRPLAGKVAFSNTELVKTPKGLGLVSHFNLGPRPALGLFLAPWNLATRHPCWINPKAREQNALSLATVIQEDQGSEAKAKKRPRAGLGNRGLRPKLATQSQVSIGNERDIEGGRGGQIR